MSELKHTPGPWVKEKTGRGIGPLSKEDDQSYGMVIPVAYVDFAESDDVQKANANLIAAAPDMLAALIDMVSIVKKNTYPTPDKPDSVWGRMEVAQAAISKATGE